MLVSSKVAAQLGLECVITCDTGQKLWGFIEFYEDLPSWCKVRHGANPNGYTVLRIKRIANIDFL